MAPSMYTHTTSSSSSHSSYISKPVTISLTQDLVVAVKNICKDLVKEFAHLSHEDLKVEEITGGTTNKLYSCYGNSLKVLVRIYGRGTEALIDRKRELKMMEIVNSRGLGGKLYGTFNNGYVYEYIEGSPLSADELPNYIEQIAYTMAQWHKIEVPADGGDKDSIQGPTLIPVMRQWYKIAQDSLNKNPQDMQAIGDALPFNEIGKQIDNIARLIQERPKVFCHNDVNPLNIIVDDKGNMTFIDFEYCSYNYRDFDIANHFCEWAGLDLDFAKYPDIKYRRRFFRAYLSAMYGAEPQQNSLLNMEESVKQFRMVCHLYWGLWAIVQADISTIDFDFIEYAITRLSRFFELKEYYRL